MAFGESWLISVMMRFASNGARVMNEIDSAVGGANSRVDAHTRKVNEATAAWNRFNLATVKAGTMFAGGIALAGGAAILYGINQAAKLELAMKGVYAATGSLHDASMQKRLFNMVVSTSGITAQSATTIANEAYMLASGGLNDPRFLLSAFPQIAKAADVLWLSTMGTPKAVNPVEAASEMLKLAHLFGDYQGKPLHDAVDAMVRLQMVQPDALKKVVTQAKYFVPTAIAAGVDLHNLPQSDLLALMASGGQLGLMSGRMGTGLARYIQYMEKAPVMTAHLSAAQRAGMVGLGLFDAQGRNKFIDAHGNLGLGASIHYLGQKMDDMVKQGRRPEFLADLFAAFLQNGGTFMSTMLLPQVRAQRSRNILAMGRIAPPGTAVETLQDEYMHTTIGAWKYFTTNFQNIWLYTFTPMLPDITSDLRSVGFAFGQFGNTLKDNPQMASDLAHIVEGITLLASARALLGGGLWLFSLASGIKGIAAAGSLAEGVKLTKIAVGLRALDNVTTGGMVTNIARVTGGLGLLAIALDALAAAEVFKLAKQYVAAHPGTPITGGGLGLGAVAAQALRNAGILPGGVHPAVHPAIHHAYMSAAPHGGYPAPHAIPWWTHVLDFLIGGGGNLTPQGTLPRLDNQTIHALKPLSKDEMKAVFTDAMRDSPATIQLTVVDRTHGGIRSTVNSRGNHQNSRYGPPVLNLDLASPAIGTS